jgi:thiosulfate/3-mercaptopyruvate sulfurtransferase
MANVNAGAEHNDEEISPLVTPDWLVARLADTRLRILDIRSVVDGGAYTAFVAAHIPAAVYTDYTRDGWRAARGLVTGLLPDAVVLAQLFSRLGISPRHHVIVVGAGSGPADFSAASRVYWTLKTAGHRAVSILDGGMAAWCADPARSVQAGEARPPVPTSYPVAIDLAWRSDTADVVAAMEHGRAVLLDSRSAAFFRGEKKSPQAMRPGRLPGAALLDYTTAFDGSGRLRPLAELRGLFAAVPDAAVIHYCNTGQQAAANWFIMSELLCRPAMTLYDGSMAEWTEAPQRPVVID